MNKNVDIGTVICIDTSEISFNRYMLMKCIRNGLST